MRLIVFFLALWAAVLGAAAQQVPFQQTLSPPGWVLPNAQVDLNFTNGVFWSSGRIVGLDSLLTLTRATTAWQDNQAGVWQQFASGVIRLTDKGTLVEPAATNNVLQSRDMSQAAWTKSNTSASLNAVGIDGVASSASTVTASGANGSVLQSVTLSSAAYAYSVFLKRVTGTGTINTTVDGGTTWTACSTNTSTFTRCTVTKTAANPSVGIQIVTSGDVVVADAGQLETGIFATSPLMTAGATVTRNADVLTISNPTQAFVAGQTAYSAMLAFNVFSIPGTANWRGLSIGNGSGETSMQSDGVTGMRGGDQSGHTTSSVSIAAGRHKSAASFSTAEAVIRFAMDGTLATNSVGATLPGSTGTYVINIGNTQLASPRQLTGYVERLALFPMSMTGNQLLPLTVLGP